MQNYNITFYILLFSTKSTLKFVIMYANCFLLIYFCKFSKNMCTVSYIPINKFDFILTSSRDVPFVREKAIKPKEYIEDNVSIMYPKDGKSGGTWIGYSSKNRLICLLNGGFTNHIIKSNYVKSRGIIVKELLKQTDIFSALSEINLINIEPFTLVIVDWNNDLQLIEFVWDGFKRHKIVLPQKMHIWSSSTLYDKKTSLMRKQWFVEWQNSFCPKHLSSNSFFELYRSSILSFHKNAGTGNPKTNLLMKRKGVGTVSITQVCKKQNDIKMSYLPI